MVSILVANINHLLIRQNVKNAVTGQDDIARAPRDTVAAPSRRITRTAFKDVECDGEYSTGRKAFGYRLMPDYRKTRRIVCNGVNF